MTSSLIKYSMFQDVLYPKEEEKPSSGNQAHWSLRRALRYEAHPEIAFRSAPLVVFDFETTGLDSRCDRIIEVGAQKIINFEVVDEFSSFVQVENKLSSVVTQLTGITQEMLVGQPSVEEVLPSFFDFIDGSILLAHNASFDMNFLKAEAYRLGIDLDWSAFCSLKLARKFLPDLESKSLDALADYYNLTFESRHRSIGDVKVTVSVLEQMLNKEGSHLVQWSDLKDFTVE